MKSGWELVIQTTAPERALNALWEAGVPFFGAVPLDGVTLGLRVPYGALERARSVLERQGCDLLRCRAYGLRPGLGRLRRRHALLVCGAVCAVLLAVSNLFVWRIDVQGNDTVPTGAVVRAMARAGAGIGSFWPGFDGEGLRTQLLVALPELQWAGVSYHSGVVTVTVREQRAAPEVVDHDEGTHIVAATEGVITGISAKLGQPAAAVGDRVEAGQLLISGAAQSTLGTARAVHALGSVEARTRRVLTVRRSAAVQAKGPVTGKAAKISLIFWGKSVNFYIGSSFSGGTCDKIIMDYRLCMEGVFQLPVQVVVQRYEYRALQARQPGPEAGEAMARDTLMETLEQLVAGEILTTDFASCSRDEVLTMTVRAECLEEIGEARPMGPEELRQIQSQIVAGDETTND